MVTKLVLNNLKEGTTETMIRNFLFDQGKIASIKMTSPQDRQEGYAFVTMDLDRDAINVMRKLNLHQILGQNVEISRTF